MTSTHPHHPGLTRIDTGYPAYPYIGWFWTPAELTNIERRQRKRGHAVDEPILRGAARQSVTRPLSTAICKRCRTRFDTPTPQQTRRCPNCTTVGTTATCAGCGTTFPVRATGGSRQRYCTVACRKQAAKQNGRHAI